ncbi:MAG: 6-phosphofructokinase [Lachnospiraceae bacterium]
MKNVIVGQSGGPTAVINASLYGVIQEAIGQKEQIGHVYGMINGIEGFLKDQYMDMEAELTQDERDLLKITPAAYLGSCRYRLPKDLNDPCYPLIFDKFNALNIGYFFYIGGNDSMDTVSKLSRYAAQHDSEIRFIGIPKTIDNDLVQTDHTPGYASAAKYVASTVREIALDAAVYQQRAVTIIELMGRHAGWLTAASVLARKHSGDNPMLIYLPESDFDFGEFGRELELALEKQPNVVICVSEGISDASGKFICEYASEAHVDTFGHKMLTGCGKVLEEYIRSNFEIKVRSVELNVSQRCSGMIQSLTDVEEAEQAGRKGIQAALQGETGKMIAFARTSQEPYAMTCRTVDVNEVCNQEKTVPAEWITAGGSDIGQAFIDYVRPLIQGEVSHPMEDGIPKYLFRK